MIRVLRVARRGAVKARVAAAEQLYGALTAPPDELRQAEFDRLKAKPSPDHRPRTNGRVIAAQLGRQGLPWHLEAVRGVLKDSLPGIVAMDRAARYP
jgi:hypothetical protein